MPIDWLSAPHVKSSDRDKRDAIKALSGTPGPSYLWPKELREAKERLEVYEQWEKEQRG